MKNRTCKVIFLVIMLIKIVSLCGCTAWNDRQESENRVNSEKVEVVEERINELQEDIISFLKEHTEEMKKVALYLLDLEGENVHFQYYVEEKLLYRYNETDYLPQEKNVDPVLLLDTQFLDNTQLFNSIVPSKDHRIMENDICEFHTVVRDDVGELYCRICLIYCNSAPIEKEYFEISSIIPNWYFYIEYFE